MKANLFQTAREPQFPTNQAESRDHKVKKAQNRLDSPKKINHLFCTTLEPRPDQHQTVEGHESLQKFNPAQLIIKYTWRSRKTAHIALSEATC